MLSLMSMLKLKAMSMLALLPSLSSTMAMMAGIAIGYVFHPIITLALDFIKLLIKL